MKENPHLEEEQFIRAIIDESDLPEPVRRHLAACSVCGEKKQGLERELRTLGELAKRYTPSSSEGMVFPEKESSYSRLWNWQKTLAAAATTIAILVLVVSIWYGMPRIRPQKADLEHYSSAKEEERLFAEATALEENPFSPFHRFVIGGSSPVFDEGFVDFVSTSL
jgi:hypothetical protein